MIFCGQAGKAVPVVEIVHGRFESGATHVCSVCGAEIPDRLVVC